MNYYNPNPNYYMNYPYAYNYIGQNTVPSMSTPTPMSMNQNNIQQQQQQTSMIGLNGKIVDGEDVVKATEVPIGGYGFFPKADLSEIYLKTWNNNGTTSIITFKPDNKPAETLVQSTTTLDDVINKIDALENKIANFVAGSSHQKEEVDKDAFKL